jgi:hypothetical protein
MTTTNQIIAGALYSFASKLTCLKTPLTVGGNHLAGPMAEAVEAFCKENGLSDGEPDVRNWRESVKLLPRAVNETLDPAFAKRLEDVRREVRAALHVAPETYELRKRIIRESATSPEAIHANIIESRRRANAYPVVNPVRDGKTFSALGTCDGNHAAVTPCADPGCWLL